MYERVDLILIPKDMKCVDSTLHDQFLRSYFVLRTSYMNVTCFQEPTTAMETFSLLLCGVLLILGALFLHSINSKNARFKNMMKKIPGPPTYPILGTTLPFILTKRSGE
jgi:hypothetical protein